MVVGKIAAAVVVGIGGLVLKRELRRLFMPSSIAYDAAAHRAGFET